MARAKKATEPKPVESLRHQDQRTNIPTEELRDFVTDDESAPTTQLYPRDTSLDPQLVWRGKDEQDRADLAVPVVPVYIQEKIEPQAIIENLRDTAKPGELEPELSLFDDFDGIEFSDLVDFYQHGTNWSNRMILGDSLLVMTSLAEKEGLKGKVQCIYVDPPYGIKFGSNWQVSTRKRDVKDGKVEDLTRQPEQIRAFRDTWKDGLSSFLAYLRDRFTVARDLLTESGSIFVQIGDENVHVVRSVLDEVFGRENFVSLITFKKTSGASTGDSLAGIADYLLWYGSSLETAKYRQLFFDKLLGGAGGGQYTWIEEADGSRRRATSAEQASPPERCAFFRTAPLTSQRPAQGNDLRSFEFEGSEFTPGSGTFKTDKNGLTKLAAARRLLAVGRTLTYVRFLDDFPAFPLSNLWDDTVTSGFGDPKVYVVQTNAKVVERCLLMATDPGDLVLDPTCGSGTTAYVAEQWGRRWITIDTSRVALALARTRLMAARYPSYLLADSPEGAAKEAELSAVPRNLSTAFTRDVREGFVYKRVPHVTLKSIAQNPDIEEGMTREQIDAAIARHADTELLVDQPYEDRNRIRVTGRFTVESLSPHRVLDTDEDRPASERGAEQAAEAVDFVTMILENLRKAGVQNTVREERLEFDSLVPYAGEWINGEGTYTDATGESKRVAVAIGPEHGTVGPFLVKEAAKEALKGVGFDVLVVCGFAFDARVGETAREFGRLPVLPARMNPDLAMGDELLKKTGTGNLFMVFGEPDVEITTKDRQVTVEIRGVDVYDPTTGQVRANDIADIACWFVDTNYNGESFFVRHAYFTGGNDPYEKLRRSLKAEIDEAAWASLYSTTSRPFDVPETGKIAVKVINHYGDEVMQVYEVP